MKKREEDIQDRNSDDIIIFVFQNIGKYLQLQKKTLIIKTIKRSSSFQEDNKTNFCERFIFVGRLKTAGLRLADAF